MDSLFCNHEIHTFRGEDSVADQGAENDAPRGFTGSCDDRSVLKSMFANFEFSYELSDGKPFRI